MPIIQLGRSKIKKLIYFVVQWLLAKITDNVRFLQTPDTYSRKTSPVYFNFAYLYYTNDVRTYSNIIKWCIPIF